MLDDSKHLLSLEEVEQIKSNISNFEQKITIMTNKLA